MNWLCVFVYSVFAYGISNMFVNSVGPFRMFERIRAAAARVSEGLGDLFSCMLCFPAWVGIVFSVVDMAIPEISFMPSSFVVGAGRFWLLNILVDCAYTSGVVWLIDNAEEAWERSGSPDE